MAFASSYPDATEALILVEAVSDSMRIPEMPGFMKSDFLFWLLLGTLERLVGADGMAARFIPDKANSDRVLASPEKLSEFTRIIWSVWPYSLRRSGWENDQRQFLDLKGPMLQTWPRTLIIHGTADASVPDDQSKALAKRHTGAQLVLFEGADHMMPLTHREEMAEVIDRFLAQARETQTHGT